MTTALHPQPVAPRPSRVKRLVLAGFALLFGLLLAELLALVLLIATGQGFPYRSSSRHTLRDQLRHAGAARNPETFSSPVLALHPYIGYIRNFDFKRDYRGTPNNESGFYSEVEATYRPESDDEFVVVVTGGSVAAQLCTTGREHLRERIAAIPAVAGRRVIINAICQGGYKQPQQLAAISYYLVLGMHADLVINLDGVNELNFYPYLLDLGVSPTYPWNWTALSPTPNRQRDVMQAQLNLITAREQRARLADLIRRNRLYTFALGQLLWPRADALAHHREQAADALLLEAIDQQAERGLPFPQTGPHHTHATDLPSALAEAALVWRRSSQMLHDLLTARGIPYLHALQPNQYFPGIRPLHELEQLHAHDETTPFHDPLTYGYPHLLEQIPHLLDHPIAFVNLNDTLEPTPEIIYDDNFSHFNPLGYELIANALAQAIADLLAETDVSPRR
ncbi:MAG TPA: hypothetical protein PKE55_05085 [Kiritimatiellia bacterium]|nr:hypothetical protein [Kiritimatiellia bacterium]